jgi:hypothetical protein
MVLLVIGFVVRLNDSLGRGCRFVATSAGRGARSLGEAPGLSENGIDDEVGDKRGH